MLTTTVLLLVTATAGSQSPDTLDRVTGWRSDIAHLVAEARRVHAGPARPAHSVEFATAAASLSDRIPDLPDRRVVVELQRLLAMLGDGHSLVYPMPTPRAPFAMLPVDLYLFDDGLFVVDAAGSARRLIGSRVVRFGTRAADDVLRDLAPFVSRDNAMAFKSFATLYPILPAFLEAVGAADSIGPVALTVADSTGREAVISLAADSARRIRKRLLPPPAATAPVPLYLRHADRAYWMTRLPEYRAVYFQFNQVTDAAGLTLAGFAGALRDTLSASRAEHLVIDVRHNNGGNNLLLAPLLDAVARFAAGGRGRRVYVLTGRATFSAAQNFITRLERRVPGTVFAGEPSMASPNFTGEDNPVTLPFSGVVVSISNRYWDDGGPADRRPWIAPHLPATLTSRDWLANRDPGLDAVLRHLTTAGPRVP